MGLDHNGVKFLLHARRMGVSFARVAMIGRQTMLIGPEALHAILVKFGFTTTSREIEEFYRRADGYADEFIKLLGAEEVVSFDASDYEGASFVHDFNLPIADEFKNRFTVVLDGGTLEHVFDFPTAIRNCMEMVAVDGHFLGITPANNYFGHGFYQFSPELYFRLFSAERGFDIEQVALYEEADGAPWYEIADPESVRERVTLVNDHPTLMLVRARKVRHAPVAARAPQQSDYSAIWDEGRGAGRSLNGSDSRLDIGRLARAPKSALRRISVALRRRSGVLANRPRHFKPFDPES